MPPSRPLEAPQLPATVCHVLDEFLEAAKKSLGGDLLAVVLYGSAADGKLRSTSDVNLVLVLSSFEQTGVDLLRGPLRLAQAAIQLRPMFLLKREIPQASRAFASKFADILRRRVILFGDDPFAALTIPREIRIADLRQKLLNQILRLRASYVARSLREEQLRFTLARTLGPLRSAAAALLEIQDSPASSAQQAIERVGSELGMANWSETLAHLSSLHDAPLRFSGNSRELFFAVLDFVCRMHSRAEGLSGEAAP